MPVPPQHGQIELDVVPDEFLAGIVEEKLEFVCDPQYILPSVRHGHVETGMGFDREGKAQDITGLGIQAGCLHVEAERRRPGQLLDERGAGFGRIDAVIVVFHVRYRLQLVIGKQFFLAAGDGQPWRRREVVAE